MIKVAVYKEGYRAYYDGRDKLANPYDAGTEDYNLWMKGYKEGVREDVEQDPDGN